MKRILFFLILLSHYQVSALEDPFQVRVERPKYVEESVWIQLEPYLLTESHPLKRKLDKIFSKTRVLHDDASLVKAGFRGKEPPSHSKAVVIRHPSMPGYIFKIYTDSKKSYYRDQPEYISWLQRARGARLVKRAINELGYQDTFKVPRKWIYALPAKPKAKKGTLAKNFILVADEMDLEPWPVIQKSWRDGTLNKEHLDKLFTLINKIGLRGGCKYDNIPLCKDGRIAFIDTQNHLRWPLPYYRLFGVLNKELKNHWVSLMSTVECEGPTQ